MGKLATLLVGLYAWTVTIAFGAVLLDVVYASQVTPDSAVIVGEMRDVLLGLAALTVLTAFGAIAAVWEWENARYLLIASFAVVVISMLTPVILSGIIGDAEESVGVRLGAIVRIGEAGLASVLAFLGLWESWRLT